MTKFYRLKDEADKDVSAAQDLGDRMREARSRTQKAQGVLQSAEAEYRDRGGTMPARFRKEVDDATAEFARLQRSYAEACDAAQNSGRLAENLKTYLQKQGITP